MDVKFVTNNQGVVVIPCPEISPKHVIRFRRTYSTADKEEIKKLLSDGFAREKVSLAPNQDLQDISDYLESDERDDTMTKEYLRDIPFEAWREIMDVRPDIDVAFPLVGIAKATLEGQPLTSEIEDIVKKYKEDIPEQEAQQKEVEKEETKKQVKIQLGKEKKKQEQREEQQAVEEVAESEEKNSADFTVRKAIPFIEAAPEEELEGFLAEDEDRVTVLRAWNDRFPDNQVEIPE